MDNKPSLDKLFQDIYTSYKNQKPRSAIKDLHTVLKLKNTNYEIHYHAQTIPQIPTIIVANHFVRQPFLRRSFFTTSESMITSAIITQLASRFLGKKITWVVKNDLRQNLFFLSIRLRKIQLASIYCHNFIGVAQNYPFGQFAKWAKFLKAGYNICVFPEGVVSAIIREPKPGFDKLLDYLKSKKVVFQILPVSIYYKSGSFMAEVGYPIEHTPRASRLPSQQCYPLPTTYQSTYKAPINNKSRNLELKLGNNRQMIRHKNFWDLKPQQFKVV